ncbi:sensor histidine kinase [Saccharothrix hoggarensis]|uniref:histidine kinase n=1 Tax=Saccharothrix hoggarensis TaxID=913853 RepID=A0ABW3QS47_9PSEU
MLARRLPLVASVVATIAAAVDWRFLPAVVVMSYLVGRRVSDGRVARAVFPGVIVVGSVVVLSLGVDLYTWMVRLGGFVVFGVFPWLIGRYRRQQVRLVRAGWERAARLEERQRIVAEQARLRERARIAHDMHDSLGHHLSLAALKAGALEVAADVDERHRAAATTLRESIALATEQLHDIIDLLREDDPEPAIAGGERIGDLVARAAAAGVAVDLVTTGDVEDVEPMRYRAAYRAVQEAITNATKHAPGAEVSVLLQGLDDEVRIAVTNGPPAEPAPSDPSRGGRGLAELRERVRLVGGTLRAGPHEGGYRVLVRLPRAEDVIGDGPGVEADENPTVADEFDRARHGVRKRLTLAFLTPVALGTCLVVVLMGLYAYDTVTSTLPPESFHRLELGAARSAVADVVPDRQAPERGFGPAPAEPPGSTCEFYRSEGGFLPTAFDVYRLCFRDDRLVGKDVLARIGQEAGK